ncbi:MAG: molybdenum cofactor carrier protein [bacterium]
MRRTIIGVMGSSRERYEDLAFPLGKWLGQHGYHLLTGGGQGVMAAVSEAFFFVSDRKGAVIGIIPAQESVFPTQESITPAQEGIIPAQAPDREISGGDQSRRNIDQDREGRANFRVKPGYPNEWVEIPIITHLPLSGTQGKRALSRNHINVLTSRIIVALPGGPGTISEIELALEYRKPLLIFDPYAIIPDYSKEGAIHLKTFAEVISHLGNYPAINS